jgi:hypothetical protein
MLTVRDAIPKPREFSPGEGLFRGRFRCRNHRGVIEIGRNSEPPNKFGRGRRDAARVVLTPKKYQSGETGVTGGISRVGEVMVRTALYEAANKDENRRGSVTEGGRSPTGGTDPRRSVFSARSGDRGGPGMGAQGSGVTPFGWDALEVIAWRTRSTADA